MIAIDGEPSQNVTLRISYLEAQMQQTLDALLSIQIREMPSEILIPQYTFVRVEANSVIKHVRNIMSSGVTDNDAKDIVNGLNEAKKRMDDAANGFKEDVTAFNEASA